MAARRNHRSAEAHYARPHGEIRQSQVISTFGPGALVDLVNDAVVIGGLEFWHFPEKMRALDEPRLRDDLIERFKKANRKLDPQRPFREPPPGDMRDAKPSCGIDAAEFPRWFVCQNEKCRALVKADVLDRKRDRYWHDCDNGTSTECVPVRFVAACKNGHLDEFPWISWVHERNEACGAPRLKLLDGATGDFSEVKVHCVCGAWRPLINAVVVEANPRCTGWRPWLGPMGKEPCTEHIRLLTRTASNAYYSQVESALSIPDTSHRLSELVQDRWNMLKKVSDASMLHLLIEQLDDLLPLKQWPDGEVLGTIDDVRHERPPVREPLRVTEYRQLISAPAETPGELPADGETFHARKIAIQDLPGISRVVLVKKLRQVRVQVGFTRIEAATANLQGEFDLDVRSAPLSLTREWLPASEVRGEGIFLALDEGLLAKWEQLPATITRAAELEAGYERWREQRGLDMDFPGARFYLLHSLSHVLMTALSLECGYPASALGERIYCAPHTSGEPMAGILLMTGSPGAEGTLGGLVGEGRRLREHLRRALELAALCSNDPVCAHHSPKADLAERHLEGAACHGCLYVAESSCERFNNFLDRALLVRTLGPDAAAFFKDVS